jgi:flavin-dependent dehydrogenase
MTEEFDIAVAGAGPAGATISLCLARNGLRVALLEATTFHAERYGETLPPEINPVLRGLGLWDAFQALAPLEAPGIISTWGHPTPYENDFLNNPHGPGWHIDRNQFDAMLAGEAVKAGARLFTNRRMNACTSEGNGWNLDGISARTLVDASGRTGVRINGECQREYDDTLLAITLRIGYQNSRPTDLRTSIETTPSGWWYTTPLPTNNTLAMFFTDPETYTTEGISIADQLRHAPLTNARLRSGRIVHSQVVHASSSCRTKIHGADWIAVGDSASSYDPLSGRGIFKALKHALAAAKALENGHEALARYGDQVRREYEHYVRQRRLHYASEQRWTDRPFWRFRAHSSAADLLPA